MALLKPAAKASTAPTKVHMLCVSHVSVSYDGSRILRDVSLEVRPGEVLCLMGRNGVGKTTTLKSIVGLAPSDSGTISLGDCDLTRLRPELRARSGLGYVPQGRDIFPNLTVRENLMIGALAQGKRMNGEFDRVLALFPVLKEMLGRKGGVLSGGQQQQLAIGRALLTGPKILLLDEPTEGIQPNIIDQIGVTIRHLSMSGLGSGEHDYAREIGSALREVRAEGRIGILLVEQCLDFCLQVGDRFHIMDRGTTVAQGPISELSNEIIRQHLTV